MGNIRKVPFDGVEHYKIHGRTTKERNPLTFFWTGSGIEVNVSGSEVWVELYSDYDCFEPWISILVNGEVISRQMVLKGMQKICLFRNMNPKVIKNIRLVKDVQAMPDDEKHCLQLYSFELDGEFYPVKERKFKLEVIGDSITSGEGAIGAVCEEDWISMWFSSQYNYATLLANKIDADVRIISQSGWGVVSSWNNNPYGAIPPIYDKVCGPLKGERNKALGAHEKNDFQAWQPDIIVINLGTNDGGAFEQPEWRDEQTGETFKERKNEDGSYQEEDLERFEWTVRAFLRKLRRLNPNAYLLWVYGILGNSLLSSLQNSIHTYQTECEDYRVSLLELPDMEEKEVGARYHPGKKAHERVATMISEEILNRLSKPER